jgi:internalin A
MEKYQYNDVLNTLDIDPIFINEGLVYAKNEKLDKIRVLPLNHYKLYGFSSPKELYQFKLDTSSFKDFDFIKALTLKDYIGLSNDGMHGLYALKSLEYFAFENPSIKPDLNYFPHIETLYFKFNDGVLNLSSLKCLKDIMIFNLRTKDCSYLSGLLNIRTLRLSGGSFLSISGIEKSKLLTRLDITYNSKVENIFSLNKLPKLEVLNIEKCKSLNNYDFLRGNQSIKELFIDTLDSLSFLPSMKKLEKINFYNCKDGNLNFLLESKSLRNVNFYPNKKHYTHTLEDIRNNIQN